MHARSAKPAATAAQVDARIAADESTVTILSTGKTYPVNDISLGGLSINGYDGLARINAHWGSPR